MTNQNTIPRAVSVSYNKRTGKLTITLSTGVDVSFRPTSLPELATACPDNLDVIEITPSGFVVLFPRLNEGFSVPVLMRDLVTGIEASSDGRHAALRGWR